EEVHPAHEAVLAAELDRVERLEVLHASGPTGVPGCPLHEPAEHELPRLGQDEALMTGHHVGLALGTLPLLVLLLRGLGVRERLEVAGIAVARAADGARRLQSNAVFSRPRRPRSMRRFAGAPRGAPPRSLAGCAHAGRRPRS